MNPRTLTLAAVLLATASASSLPAMAQKAKPKPKPAKPYTIPGPVSISAKPNPTTFSTPVTISGRVQKANTAVTVTLLARVLPSGSFATVQTAKTTKKGDYKFSHRPPANTYYRVVAALQTPVQSADLLVPVRTLVGFRASDSTPARGSRVRFSGIVRPRHDGRRAYVQKQSSAGRWVTVARTTLRKLDSQSSRYAVTLRVRSSATYRVRVLGHSDHAMGISRSRALVVH
jgi:hypothetical protein